MTDTNRFVARFSSLCDYCGQPINTGDTAVRLNDGLCICMACNRIGVK